MRRLLAAVLNRHMAASVAGLSMLAAGIAAAQQSPSNPAAVAREVSARVPDIHTLAEQPSREQLMQQYTGDAALLRTPVSTLFPGGVDTRPKIQNPVGKDPTAAQRGMGYFIAFNCVGCHAPNGGGGMGRSLSNRYFQYGNQPANIYLSILQGRPNGMPAWGTTIPDAIIWDLVAYIEQISQAPQPQWGTTISLDAMKIEQSPAEFTTTTNPWAYTEPFSFGRKPGTGDRGK